MSELCLYDLTSYYTNVLEEQDCLILFSLFKILNTDH